IDNIAIYHLPNGHFSFSTVNFRDKAHTHTLHILFDILSILSSTLKNSLGSLILEGQILHISDLRFVKSSFLFKVLLINPLITPFTLIFSNFFLLIFSKLLNFLNMFLFVRLKYLVLILLLFLVLIPV